MREGTSHWPHVESADISEMTGSVGIHCHEARERLKHGLSACRQLETEPRHVEEEWTNDALVEAAEAKCTRPVRFVERVVQVRAMESIHATTPVKTSW